MRRRLAPARAPKNALSATLDPLRHIFMKRRERGDAEAAEETIRFGCAARRARNSGSFSSAASASLRPLR